MKKVALFRALNSELPVYSSYTPVIDYVRNLAPLIVLSLADRNCCSNRKLPFLIMGQECREHSVV